MNMCVCVDPSHHPLLLDLNGFHATLRLAATGDGVGSKHVRRLDLRGRKEELMAASVLNTKHLDMLVLRYTLAF